MEEIRKEKIIMADMIKEINGIAESAEKSFGVNFPRVSDNGLSPNGGKYMNGHEYLTPNEFGNLLQIDPNWINAFGNAYMKIAFTVISNGVWRNPLEFLFKKQEFGFAIEELFINLSKPFRYDPWGKGEEQWQRVMPDVRRMMHLINIQTFCKKTVYSQGLRSAFTNEAAWMDFRDKLVASITNDLSVALYKACKYVIALYCLETGTVTIQIANYVADPKSATKALKVSSSKMTFASPNYNPAGVENFAPIANQYLFVTPEFDAEQEVDVLAYMFQIEKGELPQRKILIDDFWNHDYDTLNEMFVGGVPKIFTEDEVNALKQMPAMLVQDNLFFFYNHFEYWDAPWNSQKLYWNYMHHWQGILSYSPFANGVALYTGTPGNITKLFNPYDSEEITLGRDNLMRALDAHTVGLFAPHEIIKATVSGEGLIPLEDHPGWYQASNKKGDTATLTYSYTPESGDALSLTITVTIV